MKLHTILILASVITFGFSHSLAQKWVVGGNTGLSLADGNAGFHIGPMSEYMFNKNMSVGTEFTINTQAGTPVIWFNYFKYYFSIPGSKVRPYSDGGVLLDFVTGGPYFGLMFGGGVNIPVANRLSISPDFQGGPVFSVGGGTVNTLFGSFKAEGTTIFTFVIRGGIRYEI